MSVARQLGVEDADTPQMRQACDSWPRWFDTEPDLAVVANFLDLRGWGAAAGHRERDRVHAALARLARFDLHDDQIAASAMTWVLLPGADNLAKSLAPLADRTDTLVASNLWIAVKTAHWQRPLNIAAGILSETRRYCLAELDMGRIAKRSDRTWWNTSQVATWHEATEPRINSKIDAIPPAETLRRLAKVAEANHVIAPGEIDFLVEVAAAAETHNGPLSRGRSGLCATAATTDVAARLGISPRQVRRRTQNILTRLRSLALEPIVLDALSEEPMLGPGSGEEVGHFGLDVLAHLGGVA